MMNKKNIASFVICFVVLIAFKPFSNIDDLANKIIQTLNDISQEAPVEKAYLHLNGHVFSQGDDLWFKAYVTAGSFNQLSPLSKVLYVDLYDEAGLRVDQRIVKVENGVGLGDFIIPPFLPQGNYTLVAYTNWMKNFGEEYFYQDQITVVDPYEINFNPSIDITVEESANQLIYHMEVQAMDRSNNLISNKKLKASYISANDTLTQTKQLDASAQAKFSFTTADINNLAFVRLELEENESSVLSKNIRLPYLDRQIDFQLLPEGGYLVEGLASNVAFKAIYPDGTGADVEGYVADESGNKLVDFSTLAFGMGSFKLEPEANVNYQVFFKTSGQSGYSSQKIEDIRSQGLAIEVDNSREGFVNVLLKEKEFFKEEQVKELLLVVQSGGFPGYVQKVDLNLGFSGVRIPRGNLPVGINEISIFEESGRQLSSRLIFIDQPSNEAAITEVNFSFDKRSKESFSLSISDNEGQPIMGDFSVSVLDNSVPVKTKGNNIKTQLLLSSDLRGRIEDPSFFFKDQSSETFKALDLLMMTHGWSRFDWNKILDGSYLSSFDDYIEQGITIQGTVSEKYPTKKGVGGGEITFFLGENSFSVLEYGADGRFTVSDLNFEDSASLVIQAKDKRVKDRVAISIDEPSHEMIKNLYLDVLYIDEIIFKGISNSFSRLNYNKYLNSNNESIVDLEEVTIAASNIVKEDISRIYGRGDVVIKPEDVPGFQSFTNVFQMIQGRIAGVLVTTDINGASIQIRGGGNLSGNLPPLILLDNVPVDILTASSINPRDVSSIEVFKDAASTSIFGAQGGGGAIAIYTKTGEGVSTRVDGISNFRYPGYSIARKYYQPKYDSPDANSVPDYRPTLLWEPNIKLDATKQDIELKFFNNDIADQYLITVEGIDSKGRILHFEKVWKRGE
ncbi:TonB-dependent receptor plug domain-containing protein [Penaeicola halotolerans]|uniref:TonB-dependent receptor plug domain-containing protein n=1 Tax=Penaeicola halotolerans TaxID=2793196 RepID=UPI001CF84527|nr:TonB-dependent receptor plug domain-containing protein [Penaeicola halotolerans]